MARVENGPEIGANGRSEAERHVQDSSTLLRLGSLGVIGLGAVLGAARFGESSAEGASDGVNFPRVDTAVKSIDLAGTTFSNEYNLPFEDYRTERDPHKINICHRTGSNNHPFEAINVDEHAFDGEGKTDHTKHGDFSYEGPIDKNGHPTKEGNQWCEGQIATPTPPPTSEVTPTSTPTPVIGEPISLPPTGGEPVSASDRLGAMWFGAMLSAAGAFGIGVWKANDIFRSRQLATKGEKGNR